MDGTIEGDLDARVKAAAARAAGVLGVSLVRVGTGERGAVAGVRVGLNPSLTLPEILRVIGRVEATVLGELPPGARVFVEPDIAADLATPTEAIVIRALD